MTLINVYREAPLETVGPTRLIEETLDVIGMTARDPFNPKREWTVQGIYLPVPGRALGGLRFKLHDQKGFITFLNQRDFEVMYQVVEPGDYCEWTDDEYPEPGDRRWLGPGVDQDDLLDDLFEREIQVREQLPVGALLPYGLEIERRVHDGAGNDYIELLCAAQDMDDEGYGPDPSFDRVAQRWLSLERTERHQRGRLWRRL